MIKKTKFNVINFAMVIFTIETIAVNWDRFKLIFVNFPNDDGTFYIDTVVALGMTMVLIILFHAGMFVLIGKFILDIHKISDSGEKQNDQKQSSN